MNKALMIAMVALAYGASAGEVLSGDAAKAKFPSAVQAMELSETKWSQLMTGVEYGFTHAAALYGVPDDLHVLKIDYAKAPIKMKILEHSPNKMRTSEAAAKVNALFAINGTMYNTSVGKPVYYHKVDGRVVNPESGNLPTKVQGLAFNPDKSFDFSGTATLTFADWDNVISCDCLLSKGNNMMEGYSWAKDSPGAGYPLIGMTPEKVLVILVIDGRRQGISQGINYYNSAELLKEFGCTEGILYDGGGSTTLAMRNDIVPDVGPDAKFATTQVVPDYCAGYTIMNYVNAGSSWVERAVIDQIAFVAAELPISNEFRVTPYVQHPAPTAMTLKFLTTTNTAATVYWWPEGNEGGVKSASVTPRLAEELQYYGDKHAQQYLPEMTPWQYRYRIEGLEPDSTYCYRVVLTDGETYEKSFRTAPAKNRAIRFVCYSDSETQPSSNGDCVKWDDYRVDQDTTPKDTRKYFIDQTVGYASNICTMVERKPDFFVVAGDLAETGSKQTHWDEYWRHNAGRLNDPAGSIPILAALGNHEYASYSADANGTAQPGEQGAKKFLSYFEFEPNGAEVDADQQQRFHRMDYGPVAMIFIDPNNGPDNDPSKGWAWEYSNPHPMDTNAQLYKDYVEGGKDKSCRVPQFQEGSAQYKWLEEQLADAQTNKLFTFLVCHQCPFSAGYHGRASGELGRGVEAENLSGVPTRCLTNLVFKYGVDGWICGHDEMYEHSQVQGEETLPDGTKRPMTLNVWDVGIGGDGLRGCRITENTNRYEVFRAHVDAPEEYDANGTLVAGGKHYGHLEVDVGLNDDGLWTAKLTPAYVFVSSNAVNGQISFERRTYDDVVVVTNEQAGVQKVTVPTASAPEGKATVTLDASEALVGGVVNGTLADVADGYSASVFVGGRKVAVKDGAFSFVASDEPAQNQVTVSLVSDYAWYLAPSNRVDLKIASGVSTGYAPGDIMTTEDGANILIAPSLSAYSGGKAGLVQYAANDLYGMTSETPPTPVNGSFVAHGSTSASVASFAVSAAAGFALNGSGYGDTSHGAAEQDLRDDRDLSVVWPFGGQWGDAANFGAASDARVAVKTDMVKSMEKLYERLAPLVFSTDGTKVYGNNYYQPEVYEFAVVKEGNAVKSILCTGRYWTLPARATAMASASVNGEDVVFLTCENGEFVSFKPFEGVVGNNDFTARYAMLKSYRQLVVTGRADGNLHLIGNTTGGQVDVYAIAADGSGLASTEPLATANTSTALIKPIANGFTCRDDELGAVFNYRTDADVYVRTVSKAGYGALPEIDDPEYPFGPDQPDDPPSPPEEPEDETVIYVSPSGDGTAPHRGFATGYANIQTAVAAAQEGDTVLLDRTTFTLTAPVEINKAITVCGAGENWETVLDGENHDCQIKITKEGAVLHSLTFTRIGTAYTANLGLSMSKSSVVSNVVARGNGNAHATGNARFPMNITAGLVTHCWITNNVAPNNAGITISSATMENCYIADNVDCGKGGGNGFSGIVVVGSNAILRNCTIVNNQSAAGGMLVSSTSGVKLYNNIIWGNVNAAGETVNWTGSFVLDNVYGNCTFPHVGRFSNGNIVANPQLQDDAMHFCAFSPCHQTANKANATTYDIEGQPRGDKPSIGAFEYKAPVEPVCAIVVDKTAVVQPESVHLSVVIDGPYAEPLTYAWDFDGDGEIDSSDEAPELTEIGDYAVTVQIEDADGKRFVAAADVPIAILSEGPVIRYVSPTGDGTAPMAGFETGYSDINKAIDAANAGDIVMLDKTTFTLKTAVVLDKAVAVCGAGENWETVLDGENKDNQIRIIAAGALLHSLTYTRIGTAYTDSLGLIMSANSTVSNVVARQNGNAHTSGNCRYPMNVSAGLVTHCWITNNYACNNGGVTLSKARMENCYIADNANLGKSGSWLAVVEVGNEAILCNCTIVDNKSANYVVNVNNKTAKVYNNIIWGNTYYASSDANNWTLTGTATADSWYGNCTSPICGSEENGNTGDDPLLGEDRRHFARLSPCNHKAVSEYAPAIDMDLVPRGETPSIGAFEYVDSGTLSANIVASDTSVTQPSTITLSCTLDGAYAEPLTYAWDLNGDGAVDTTVAEPVLSDVDLYTPSVTVTDAAGKVATAKYPLPIIVFSEEGAVFVTSQENPGARPPYATRATAATNLADAITYAQVGSKILLDEGTHYIDKVAIELNKGVTVSGEKGAEKTFLAKHSGTHQLFAIKSKDAVVENVTVQNGNFINYAKGAIILATQGTVRDCRFVGNKINGHGAVSSEQSGSGVLIERCVFEGNLVTMGSSDGNQGPACIKTYGGQTTIRNCLFVSNTNTVSGTDKSYWGGAVLLSSDSARLVNCTFVGNVSYNGGTAGVYNSANGTVVNCICVNNMQRTNDVENAGQYVYLDSNDIGTNPAKQSHSLVWPTTYDYSAFTKVLTEDPQFKTNYTFSSYGPCVRTGLYQDWMKGATDFFGNPRATPGKHVDMGYWQSPDPGMLIRVR